VDFVKRDYYAAYDEMIRNLAPLLLIPNQDPRLIERLDFRPDLPRGSKNMIYLELARLLQSGSSVLRDGVCKNDLFRWLAERIFWLLFWLLFSAQKGLYCALGLKEKLDIFILYFFTLRDFSYDISGIMM
jgi:hypothetical protein